MCALKGNQGRLHEAVQALFADAQAVGFVGGAHAHHREVDGAQGRVEIRAV